MIDLTRTDYVKLHKDHQEIVDCLLTDGEYLSDVELNEELERIPDVSVRKLVERTIKRKKERWG